MKNIFLLLLIIIILPLNLYSQIESSYFSIDSLNNVLEKVLKSKNNLNIARTYYKQSKLFYRISDFEKELEYLYKALDHVKNSKNYRAIGIITNSIAGTESTLKDPEKTIEKYLYAIENFHLVNDSVTPITIYANISSVYLEIGDNKKALEYAFKSLNLNRNQKDSTNTAGLYRVVAETYKYLNDYENFKKYLFKAKSTADRIRCTNYYIKNQIINDMGLFYINENKYYKAIDTYKEQYRYSSKNHFTKGIINSLINIAEIWQSLGKYQKALNNYNIIKISYLDKLSPLSEAAYNYGLGELYTSLKDYEKAESYYQLSLKSYQIINQKNDILKIYKSLYLLYKKEKKFTKALDFFETYSSLNDSLVGEVKQKEFATLEVKYDIKTKNLKINELQIESKFQKVNLQNKQYQIYFIIVLTFVCVIVIVFFSFLRSLRSTNLNNELKQKLLKTQMNPHFIFNALASIQNFIYDNKLKEAARFLASFSTLSRSVLTNSDKDFIPLSEEIQMLTDYLSLEKLRFNNSFDFKITSNEEEDLDFINIPPMMIQPFTENAIKHGLTEIKDQGLITISFTCEDKIVKIEIYDNGIGINKTKTFNKKSYKSMAMDIFKKRKSLLEKKYKIKLNCSIEDLSNFGSRGTRIILELPIIE